MRVKRAHKKTRTGCKTCRTRRVKCDEESPTCENCFKRGVDCIWDESPASSSSSSVASPGVQTTAPVYDTLGQSLTTHGASTIPLDLSTLELMHHYTNTTCFSHGFHPDVVEVWKTVVPSLAFSSQAHFLAHAILAISAAQLSQSHSEQTLSLKYSYAAASHFDNARRAFMAVLDASPEPDSLGISFLTHHILVIYSLSTTKSLLSPDWISLFRMHISPQKVAKKWSQYVKGPIGPLMLYLADRHLHYVNQELNIASYPFPDYLSVIHLPTSGAPDSQEVLDPDVSQVYAGAVDSTRRAALILSNPHFDAQHVAWYMDVPYQFWMLLWARRPRALVIAAHYCAIMSHMTAHYPTPWWIPSEQRWQRELADIRREVGGDWDDWLPQDDQLAMTAWIG